MKAEKEPLTAEQLRAQLLHIVSGCESWTNTGAIVSMLDTDTPRVRVLSTLQQLSIELLVDHKRDRASDMWMRMVDAERPVVLPGAARETPPAEPALSPQPRHLSIANRVLAALCQAGSDGATAGLLKVNTAGATLDNIYNALSDLRRSGDVVTQKLGPHKDRHYAKGFEPKQLVSEFPDRNRGVTQGEVAPRHESAPTKAHGSAASGVSAHLPTNEIDAAVTAAIEAGKIVPSAAASSVRFARWSTGELIIDRGDKQIELPRADVEAMLDFLGVSHARAIA